MSEPDRRRVGWQEKREKEQWQARRAREGGEVYDTLGARRKIEVEQRARLGKVEPRVEHKSPGRGKRFKVVCGEKEGMEGVPGVGGAGPVRRGYR